MFMHAQHNLAAQLMSCHHWSHIGGISKLIIAKLTGGGGCATGGGEEATGGGGAAIGGGGKGGGGE